MSKGRRSHRRRALTANEPVSGPIVVVLAASSPEAGPVGPLPAPITISRRALDAHQAMRTAGASAAALALLGAIAPLAHREPQGGAGTAMAAELARAS